MLTRPRHHHQRGFSLAEILVTTAIFAIIMMAALAVYDRSNRVFKTSTEAADLQQSTRIGFDKLVSDVRMAGFDYNRGGQPTNSWQAPQPDEQIEYAGRTAVVFRSNFNYNVPGTPDNGVERDYTPKNVNGQDIFPYVTTSNDEIIAYVLRSTTASANSNSISFWVDSFKPRAGFPSTVTPAPAGGNPSRSEEQITIGGIDITNNNPPYTLYRVSVSDVKNGSLGTPVAENIRSLNFQYFTDFTGTNLLKNSDATDIANGRNADGTTFAATGSGAIGGDGRFDPNNPAVIPDRNQRATIAAVRISLVGMNASPDLQGYTNPTETIAAIKSYRQYSLSSLVVPRNLGLTGFPEPNFNPPAPPTIVAMCGGHCGATKIYWDPPSAGGEVVSYLVEWDTTQNGAFSANASIPDPSLRSAILPDPGDDPALMHYYRMRALNDNGQSPPSGMWQLVPKNKTKPQPPTANGGAGGQTNKIPLTLTAPSNNVAGKDQLTCSGVGGSTDGTQIPSQEPIGFRILRSVDNFATDPGVKILDPVTPPAGLQPPQPAPGETFTWDDSGANSAIYPANCTDYYYRFFALDRCCKSAAWNVSGDPNDSISTASATIGPFRSTSTIAPSVPPQPSIQYPPSGPDPLDATKYIVKIAWPAVLSDTATNKIGIEQYELTRAVRLQGSGAPYLNDPLFGTLGQRAVNCDTGTCTVGYSQLANNATRSFTDGPPLRDGSGLALEYRYTVASKNCSLYSGNSPNSIVEAGQNATTSPVGPNPYVDFPGCTTNSTITPTGSLPQGNGETPLTPYVLRGGDSVVVTPSPPAGTTVNSVVFKLYTWPAPVEVNTQGPIASPGPYVYSWTDQTGGAIYSLVITINTTKDGQACNETRVKYIEQQPPAPCFIGTVNSAPGPSQGSGGTATGTFDFTTPGDRIRNDGTEDMKMVTPEILTPIFVPAFTGNIKITWSDTTLEHPEMIMSNVEWHFISAIGTDTVIGVTTVNSPGVYNRTGTGIGTSTITTTVSAPATYPTLPPGARLGFRIRYTYDATKGARRLSSSMISKLCVAYRIATEPNTTKSCNRIGQANPTANPTSCD